MKIAWVWLLALVAGFAGADEVESRDASEWMQGKVGALVAAGPEGRIEHNPERSATRFVPASTFKIANMLIALETGVASGKDFELAWNGKQSETFWPRDWSRDHTLRSAMVYGVLWYYQEIARRIGAERMAEWVGRFGYGNADTDGVIDRFWLDGPLQISAHEQVDFLQRFDRGELGLSERTTRLGREVIFLHERDGVRWSGKTGTRPLPDGRYINWFVGFAESDSHGRVAFALNLDCVDMASCDHRLRKEMVATILREWELIP